MRSKTDSTYLDLRERILFGELKPGTPFSAADMAEHYDLHINMARRLMVAMKVGGYLTRSGPSYVISTFTHTQVEEWRLALATVVEIGALRLALSPAHRLQPLADFVDRSIRDVPVDHEDFFLGAIGLTHIVLGGNNSTLSELVTQFIPQAFFRLLWLSDTYADRTGFLVEASDRFLAAAEEGDLARVRQASRFFFDGIAPSLRTLIEKRERGIYPGRDRKDGFQTIEHNIAGYPTHAGSSRTFTPVVLPLVETDLVALEL